VASTAYAEQAQQATTSDLKGLDRLVGTWRVSGGAEGTSRYEWMEGGQFLIQHVDLDHGGSRNTGMEIIGHLQLFGQPRTPEIWSRYYGSDGATLDYVYELEGDTLTIWAGGVGSPAFYKGTFSEDGNTLSGEWTYPGGGYESTSTRIS
jgi:hypothetical protein